jgi:hypothetical protein
MLLTHDDWLEAIADDEVERILQMTDEEILAEAMAEGTDLHKLAEEQKLILDKAVVEAARRELLEHKAKGKRLN